MFLRVVYIDNRFKPFCVLFLLVLWFFVEIVLIDAELMLKFLKFIAQNFAEPNNSLQV